MTMLPPALHMSALLRCKYTSDESAGFAAIR